MRSIMLREERVQATINLHESSWSPYYKFLPGLIRERRYTCGIEIGVYSGGHARAILDAGVNLLVGIDPYKMFENNMLGLNDQADWDCLHDLTQARLHDKAYLHMRRTSDDSVQFLTLPFDFVFIDGLHTYEQAKKDLDNYSQLIRPGGVILCDDYNPKDFPGIVQAIDEFATNHALEIKNGPMSVIYMDKL